MKVVELAVSQEDCWRKIALTLIDRVVNVVACLRQLGFSALRDDRVSQDRENVEKILR